jgi:hypothetical protein
MVGLGVYVLLSVLLLGNSPLGSNGWLFPFGFSVFIVSIAIYLVFILAFLFPLHWWLVVSEPSHPTLYTLLHFLTSIFFLYAMGAIVIYMIEQAYIFKPGTIFVWIKDSLYYTSVVKPSFVYGYIMTHQDIILPLWVLLMLYKILLSNLINSAILSVWYNLANVRFYKNKDDAHYRVEFHEVWGHGSAHDDHSDSHDDTHATHGANSHH